MKIFVYLFLLLIPSANFAFKKNEMAYSIVISKADLIVDGTISKVFENKYEFAITQFIKGKSPLRINVVIWKEWMCDSRVHELQKGQRLLLFLENKPNNEYYPINESTGELFIEKDSSVSPSMYMIEKFPNASVIKEGISMFLKTYTFHSRLDNRYYLDAYFQSNKSTFEIYEMKQKNKFFKFLIDSELQYYKVKETSFINIRLE
ncbi:hypothetical protein RB619_19595 [Flavobacterium sp. LHD-80]|uniref:hypothetical protein n=1 Tax=Flavobacterium sp. LHD-80 TaxID=3071411 RepID=UPI0027E175AD|nr:hypothetical protein [Flavobacterium sp. LHD-80]MDQ6472851.1 hypothetical protein [Flavobacterium sp. LHD-80]